MPELTILQNKTKKTVHFEGETLLDDLLRKAEIFTPHHCAGLGKCGRCSVVVSGDISLPTDAEKKAGTRLSCQTRVFSDATVILPDNLSVAQIETETHFLADKKRLKGQGIGAAVDIGTTTVAVKIFDLQNGKEIGVASGINPQISVAADVIGRIEAAMDGKLPLLKSLICDFIEKLIVEASPDKTIPDSLVITGNTTMLYLFSGLGPKSFARAPFKCDNLFGTKGSFLGATCYFPPCMNAFVGADITCAVLASDMCEKHQTALLCDIGTNGEIALFKEGKLYVTSTAAGPAFEGEGISCGCGCVAGAIDKVFLNGSTFGLHTVNDEKAVGICGSGLVDAICVGLDLGLIDETGAMDGEFCLTDSVALQPKDIRAVQLAKAAIFAGIKTLLQISNTNISEIERFFIAGGFGSHLNIENAAKIGLIPKDLTRRTVVLGNAALSGAIRVLLDSQEKSKLEKIATVSQEINLGGNANFNENYIEAMLFSE